MNAHQQQLRRKLKKERKAIERAVSRGEVRGISMEVYQGSKMRHAMRVLHVRQSQHAADSDASRRIADIGRLLSLEVIE